MIWKYLFELPINTQCWIFYKWKKHFYSHIGNLFWINQNTFIDWVEITMSKETIKKAYELWKLKVLKQENWILYLN